MSRYAMRLRADKPPLYLIQQKPQPIETLPSLVAGLVVRTVVAADSPFGAGYQLAVELDRPAHGDAVVELDNALRQLGLAAAQMFIDEVVTDMLAGASAGAAVGAGAGAVSRNVWVIIGGAALGFLAGVVVGDARQSVKTRYQADLVDPFRRVWQVTQLPPLDAEPGFAPA